MEDTQTVRLLAACASLRAFQVDALLRQFHANSLNYIAPLSQMLQTAAFNDNAEVAAYLLARGAPFSNAVMEEIRLGHSFAVYKVLVSHTNDPKRRAIPWVDDILKYVCPGNDIAWARFCLENGADPNLMVGHSLCALAAAAGMSTVQMAELLLQHGAKMEGSGAIVIAAERGKLAMVEFLLNKGADIDEIVLKNFGSDRATQEGGSALHKAVTNECEDVVGFLLFKGADVHLLDIRGRTPLMRAKENGNDNIISLLGVYGAAM